MRLILLILLITLTLIAGNSSAREIQKWTDENGRVHYGDYTEQYKAKTLNVTTTSPSENASNSYDTNRNETRDKLIKSMQDKRLQKKENKDKKNNKLAVMKQNCSRAKSQFATMKNGGRLIKYDENGERHFLDDKEIAAGLAAAKKAMGEWCK